MLEIKSMESVYENDEFISAIQRRERAIQWLYSLLGFDSDTTTPQLAFAKITGVLISFNNVPRLSAAINQKKIGQNSDNIN